MPERREHPCPLYTEGHCKRLLETVEKIRASHPWQSQFTMDTACHYSPDELLSARSGDQGWCSMFPGYYRRLNGERVAPHDHIHIKDIPAGVILQQLLEEMS